MEFSISSSGLGVYTGYPDRALPGYPAIAIEVVTEASWIVSPDRGKSGQRMRCNSLCKYKFLDSVSFSLFVAAMQENNNEWIKDKKIVYYDK